MNIREPSVAGTFYPASPDILSRDVEAFIGDAAPFAFPRPPVALVVPHAGYVFSGPVAGHSYRVLRHEAPDAVIILALSHRYRLKGASVMPEGRYRTPLGDAVVDHELAGGLLGQDFFSWIPEADATEHSLEVQVPFVQKAAPGASIVPVTVGTDDLTLCSSMGESVARAVRNAGKKVLIVISTDLSHFYSYDRAVALDEKFIAAFNRLDAVFLSETLSRGEAEACGKGPLQVGITASRSLGAHEAAILSYANSGDTAGDKNRVVGYLAAAIY